MSDPKSPGDLPPDLPPEYAEAYRRGYERAYKEAAGGSTEPQAEAYEAEQSVEPEPPEETDEEPTQQLSGLGGLGGFETFGQARPEPPPPTYAEPAAAAREPGERPPWLVPAVLAGLVVLLLLSAYGIGRLFSSSVEETDVSAEKPDGLVLSEDGSKSKGPGKTEKPHKPQKPAPGSYQGPTSAAAIGGATASCQAPSSVDAAGNPIDYRPEYAYDGDLTTAWRCNGDGVGHTLTLALPDTIEIGEVGLVPGYAKTDPASGADRYAENNRIIRVRWTFSNGRSVIQRLDGSPSNRSMQTLRIPATAANQVVVEILASTPGPRNTVAVSDVRIGQTAG